MLEVDCPSGLKGTVRSMKVSDEVALSDPVLTRAGKGPAALVERCWMETRDPAFYEIGASGHPLWPAVLLGDRFYIMLQIRVASYGDEYAFNVTCTSQTCRSTIPWEIKISDLEVRPLPPASRVAYQERKNFLLDWPDFPKVEHRMLLGEDEPWIIKGAEKDPRRRGLWDLIRRIVSVEGVAHCNDDNGVKKILAWYEDLDVGVRNDFREELESHDCGVQTVFDVQCQSCGRTQEVMLPLEGSFFTKVKRSGTSPYLQKTGSKD